MPNVMQNSILEGWVYKEKITPRIAFIVIYQFDNSKIENLPSGFE